MSMDTPASLFLARWVATHEPFLSKLSARSQTPEYAYEEVRAEIIFALADTLHKLQVRKTPNLQEAFTRQAPTVAKNRVNSIIRKKRGLHVVSPDSMDNYQIAVFLPSTANFIFPEESANNEFDATRILWVLDMAKEYGNALVVAVVTEIVEPKVTKTKPPKGFTMKYLCAKLGYRPRVVRDALQGFGLWLRQKQAPYDVFAMETAL